MAAKQIVLTGEIIRAAREARGMAGPELAARVGISVSYLAAIEGGLRIIHQDKAYAKLMRHVLFGESIEKQNQDIKPGKVGRPPGKSKRPYKKRGA